MKYLLLLFLFYVSIEASDSPIHINLCGKYSNGSQIEYGQMCDAKRRCANARNGQAECWCDWVGDWRPHDGGDQSKCICKKDRKDLQLIEIDGKCICPDNKGFTPVDGCVTPDIECRSNEIKACYDLTGCYKNGAIKYKGHRELCHRPCVAKCVSKNLVLDQSGNIFETVRKLLSIFG